MKSGWYPMVSIKYFLSISMLVHVWYSQFSDSFQKFDLAAPENEFLKANNLKQLSFILHSVEGERCQNKSSISYESNVSLRFRKTSSVSHTVLRTVSYCIINRNNFKEVRTCGVVVFMQNRQPLAKYVHYQSEA